MKQIIEKYHAIVGRAPSPREVKRLGQIGYALKLHENDALWSVLIALEDYDQRYRMAPARIEEALAKAVAGIRDSANHETRAAAARAIEAMAKEAGRVAQEIATKTAGRDRSRWMVIMAGVCATVLFLTAAGAFYAGHKTGAAATTDLAAWALTNEGQDARALAETGSLRLVTHCSGEGWRIEPYNGRDVCRPANGAGWYIP
ncbi:MAG: hypothetical protein ACLGIP_17940 [Alphaproteobacteria bacterium]